MILIPKGDGACMCFNFQVHRIYTIAYTGMLDPHKVRVRKWTMMVQTDPPTTKTNKNVMSCDVILLTTGIMDRI